MSLKNIQLAVINPIDRDAGRFEVVVYSDDGLQFARFVCGSERAAVALRNAIREHADCMYHVANYRGYRE